MCVCVCVYQYAYACMIPCEAKAVMFSFKISLKNCNLYMCLPSLCTHAGNVCGSSWEDGSARHAFCCCVSGCDPKIMGIGPVPASRAALEKAGKTVQDMDVVEVRWTCYGGCLLPS